MINNLIRLELLASLPLANFVPHLVQVESSRFQSVEKIRSGEDEVAETVQECDNLIWLLLNLLCVYHSGVQQCILDKWVLTQDALV
jgi:hypothetical protein